MNIYAEENDKVIFSNPFAGYTFQKENMISLGFEIGKIYTIDWTEVGNWSTDIYLKEFPNKAFNSVFFEDFEENGD